MTTNPSIPKEIAAESASVISTDRISFVQEQSSSQRQDSLLERIQKIFRSRLVGTIATTAGASLILVGVSTANVWNVYSSFKTAIANQFVLQGLSNEIVYLDEVLTMSARMSASTGNLKWEERYNGFVPKLDKVIKDLEALAPQYKEDSAKTVDANTKLIDLETRSFALVRQGKKEAALELLLGKEYEGQKQIYSQGVNQALDNIKTSVETELQSYSNRLFWSVGLAGISLILLLSSWSVVLWIVRGYIQERERSLQTLLDSQTKLQSLNAEIEDRSQQIENQKEATQKESQALQEDVSHILDVVSAVEEGDLTVEAAVSDRATGLVSDTLNRLIEELAKTMGVVLATSQQIDRSADDLKQLAVTAAQQVEQQTRSVVQVQSLMANVNEMSQDTAEQAIQSNAAVQSAQAAVSQGQQEIAAMNKGVVSLQEGAAQIVKRTQSLAEFVASAAQFTNDQKRVASLTRVLALNASMIAARASAQQDPEQFASVAKEFETIANQVNELAVQTNQSLVLLQQRTDRIQTVVSGVDDDVQEITGLVENFTQGVERSRQVLNNIQAVTEQVAQVGAQVTQSSQAIAEAARTTLGTIDDIASVATETEQQSRFTRDKAEGMDRLARILLGKVQFFRLPSNLQEDETVTKALSFTSEDDTVPDLVKTS
jgi:methyl-accepting chemotaxis protein PixJ